MSADDHATDWDREFWLLRRQAILIELAAIEQKLGLPRSVPKRQREARRCSADQQVDGQEQTTV